MKRIPIDKSYSPSEDNISIKLIQKLLSSYGFDFGYKQVERLLKDIGARNRYRIDNELNGIAFFLEDFVKEI